MYKNRPIGLTGMYKITFEPQLNCFDALIIGLWDFFGF